MFAIYINTEWGHSYKNAAKEAFTKAGGEYIGEAEADQFDKDFRTYLTQAKKTEADVIFINVANGSPTGLLLKQATELGLDRQIVASYNLITPDTIKFAENAAEGVIFAYPKIPDTEKARTFRNKYKERFGLESEIHAANSYDALHLLAEMLKICDKDTDCIKNELHSMDTYSGVGGDFKFDKNGDVHKDFEIWTVKDGKRQATQP